jgi:hypothetical protein
MGYHALMLTCCCGAVPDRILEVGFTTDRQVVVHFWCSECNRVLYVCKPVDECFGVMSGPGEDLAGQMAAADARFLESLGIAVE